MRFSILKFYIVFTCKLLQAALLYDLESGFFLVQILYIYLQW